LSIYTPNPLKIRFPARRSPKGEALKAIDEGKRDIVVLQEQSTLGVNDYADGIVRVGGDQIFRPHAEKWASEIRRESATFDSALP
jgi:hypothetical protein